ncbi:FkbM family methyltransferase [Alsobacter sp. KACC 23698]|uniref:FkbM family methyltransferase n=1 Tax=Alsobacter sp. KACC 23698 TaxID=3149229 RepID=A0AAU7JJK0_9HYPH
MKDGFWMQLDPRQSVDREMVARGGVWEPALRAVMKRYLRPGDAFVDVGAHKGWASCLGARLTGPGGLVVSVDPDPRAFAGLMANIVRNEFATVQACQCALGDADGELRLSLTRTIGNTSAFPNHIARSEVVEELTVRCTTLDSLLRGLDIKGRDLPLIKMDAEGAEPTIWDGMQATLSAFKPAIALEINYASLQAARRDLGEFKTAMEQSGYTRWFRMTVQSGVWGRPQLSLKATDLFGEDELLIDVLAIPQDGDRMAAIRPFIH